MKLFPIALPELISRIRQGHFIADFCLKFVILSFCPQVFECICQFMNLAFHFIY